MAKYDISEFIQKIEQMSSLFRKLPNEIGTIAVNFSKERFREQAWLDTSSEPWNPRKRKRKGGKKRSQTLLVDTGRLKRSLRKISVSEHSIVIGSDVPYAEIQNDGGTISKSVSVKSHIRNEHIRKRGKRKEIVRESSVRGHIRRMNTTIPSRRFMGESKALEDKITEYMEKAFKDTLNTQ
jgi:phage gpG-like protein